MENKKYNAAIDIVKYICAIMIVDSHIRLINIEKSFLFDLYRFALYFFHCSFGYYFYKGLLNNKDKILSKNIKRLLTPLLFWILIYLLINLYNNVLAGSMNINDFMALQFRSLFVNGVGFHLWFLVSCTINVTIVYIFYKNKLLKYLYSICIVLFIVGLLGSYYYQIGNIIPLINLLINTTYFTTICRLFLHGLPMFVMGIYISDKEETLNKISNNKLNVCILILFILSLLEIYIAINCAYVPTNICALGLCLFNFFLYILLLRKPMDNLKSISKPLKYISTFMYYSHPLFRTVLASLFMRAFGIEINALILSIIVVVLCSLFGYGLYRINNKYLNKIRS